MRGINARFVQIRFPSSRIRPDARNHARVLLARDATSFRVRDAVGGFAGSRLHGGEARLTAVSTVFFLDTTAFGKVDSTSYLMKSARRGCRVLSASALPIRQTLSHTFKHLQEAFPRA